MSLKASIVYKGKETVLNDTKFDQTHENLVHALRQTQTSCDEFLTKMINQEINANPKKKLKLDKEEDENANDDDEGPERDDEDKTLKQNNFEEEPNNQNE